MQKKNFLSNSPINKICLDFLETILSNKYQYAVLTGSHANGVANKSSDIDIIVFSELCDKFKQEQIKHKGNDFDLMVLPLEKIEDLLFLDYRSGNGLFLGMIAKAKVLKDESQRIKSLIKHCKALYQNGREYIDPNLASGLKVKIKGKIKYLKKNHNKTEDTFLIIDIYQEFLEFLVVRNQFWKGNSKMIHKQVLQIDNGKLLEQLNLGVEQYFSKNKKDLLLNTISEYMKVWAGNDNISPTEGTLNYISEDYIILKIIGSDNLDIYETWEYIKKSKKEILKKIKNPDEYWVFRANNHVRGEYSKNELYMIVFQKKEIINQELYELIKIADSLQNEEHSFYLPIGLDLSLIFNPFFSNILMKKTICKFNNELLKETLTSSKALLIALETFYEISLIAISPNSFCNYVYESWSSKGYDTGVNGNFEALTLSKVKQDIRYQNLYIKQQNSINSFFKQKQKYGNYFLSFELTSLIKQTFENVSKNNFNSPINLKSAPNTLTDCEKSKWFAMKTLLDWILGTLVIKESEKPFVAYVILKLPKHHLQ